MSTAKPTSLIRIVLATSIGNALEWFDIAIYGFFRRVCCASFFSGGE